jgi:hypothetical protein
VYGFHPVDARAVRGLADDTVIVARADGKIEALRLA